MKKAPDYLPLIYMGNLKPQKLGMLGRIGAILKIKRESTKTGGRIAR